MSKPSTYTISPEDLHRRGYGCTCTVIVTVTDDRGEVLQQERLLTIYNLRTWVRNARAQGMRRAIS